MNKIEKLKQAENKIDSAIVDLIEYKHFLERNNNLTAEERKKIDTTIEKMTNLTYEIYSIGAKKRYADNEPK